VVRKVCVVTGARADYGLLRWVMDGIRRSEAINRKVEMLMSSDTAVGVTKSVGLGMIGFADTLDDLKPDVLLLLGDRFELLAAATAALIARIPIAHLHGGEVTEGAFDEAIRHSITKMSHLHFVAAEEYRRRVIQIGEAPHTVFTVGGLGIDNILRLDLLTRSELEAALNFELGDRSLLVTFHPVTLEEGGTSAVQMRELLTALAALEDTRLVFTLPNADTEGRELIRLIEEFVASRPSARAFPSLGQLRYLSCIRHVDGVVGNSSSGLIEVPALKKGTVNIGDRQKGRLRASSVIDCEPDSASIAFALQQLFSPDFQSRLAHVVNPYGDGGASETIVSILEAYDLSHASKKRFYDLP
jgi:GDP/UDP-N,N'-diacetylbacillosamine 2-epimerase (hydrolysing)